MELPAEKNTRNQTRIEAERGPPEGGARNFSMPKASKSWILPNGEDEWSVMFRAAVRYITDQVRPGKIFWPARPIQKEGGKAPTEPETPEKSMPNGAVSPPHKRM